MVVYVCQASYGDTLALEIDHNPPKLGNEELKSKTRRVILIDGGPAVNHPTGKLAMDRIPLVHLFKFLSDRLPYYSNKLDTLVVTHDDEDHILGIAALLRSLNDTTNETNPDTSPWPRGTSSMKKGRAPFASIWHNSAETIVKKLVKREPSAKKLDDPGYFDEGRRKMAVVCTDGVMPKFNAEFAKKASDDILLQAGHETYRGHAKFTFLGPDIHQLDGLAKFFRTHQNTKGGIRRLTEDDIRKAFTGGNTKKDIEALSKGITKKPSNDQSLKNQSSIVFEVSTSFRDPKTGYPTVWKGLFTGDASAATLFKDSERLKGMPRDYDLIKIGHHGSVYNNFMGARMVTALRNRMTKDQLTPKVKNMDTLFDRTKPFVPTNERLEMMMPETVNLKDKEVISLTGVLAYFCNVRAKKYIISASHDVHPNPHLSTLVGLIARSVLFPEPEPVKIYLTNPITRDAWNRITQYWIQVAKSKYGGLTPVTLDKKLWSSNFADHADDLVALLESQEDQTKPLSNAGQKAIEQFRGLHDDVQSKFYTFYVLRPEKSYSAIHAGPVPSELNLQEVDWVPIEPNDSWNYLYMSKNYHDTLVAKTGDFSGIPSNRFLMEKTAIDQEEAVNKIFFLNPLSPFPSPAYPGVEEEELAFNFNVSVFSPDFTSRDGTMRIEKPKDKKKPFTNMMAGSWQSQSKLMSLMTVVPEIAPDKAPITLTSGDVALVQVSKPASSTANTKRILVPEARHPNYEVFRKFEIDGFSMPLGDDLITATKLKMKHIATFSELLAYLALNNKLKVEQALRIKTQGMAEGHPTLGMLMHLVMGIEGAESILKTFPINFVRDVKLMPDLRGNPLLWPVQIVDIVVVDLNVLGNALANASGIQQIRFRIISPTKDDKPLTWVVPNRLTLLGKGRFEIHILEYIDVTIYWPTDNKRRIVNGKFRGTIPTRPNQPEHPIICEWLVMPEEERPVIYHIQFADEAFETANHQMSIVEMMTAFDSVSVDLALAALNALPAEFVDLQKTLGDHLKLTNPGFTLSRDVRDGRDLRLHGVFGTFSLTDVPEWKPFGDGVGKTGLEGFLGQIRIPTPSLRLRVRDIFESSGPKLFFRLTHSVKIGNSDLGYELETRPAPQGGRLFEFTFLPVDVNTQEPLTVAKLLATFGLNPISEGETPDFLSKALSSTSLRLFRLGWAGDLTFRLPDYLEVAIRLEDLQIADGLLDIDDVLVRLRIDYPGQKERRNVYLQSGGIFHLVNVEHLASFTYGVHPLLAASKGGGGPSVNLAIRTTDTPLTLGAILDHFWPKTEVIPYPFNIVTNEVGLTEFRFIMDYDSTLQKQVVEQLHIGLGVVSSEIEILEGLSLVSPTLAITGIYPFDSTRRVFVINFSTMIMIEEYNLMVNVGVVTGKSSQFGVSLRAGGDGFPVGEFLKFFGRKIGESLKIPYPDGFGPLDTTDINDFRLLIGKGEDGKLAVQDFSIGVLSNLQLELWDDPHVVLDRVELEASYQRRAGFKFVFSAELGINEHTLLTTVGFGSPRADGMGNSADPGDKVWFIEATYGADIDLLAIASRLAKIDVGGNVSGTKLPNMETDSKGITLQNLTFRLQKATKSVGGSFYISAHTDWSVFKHVEFAASYQGSNEWGFCLCLALKSHLLSLVPVDFIKDWDQYVEINNTVIALYVGKTDPRRAGITQDLPPVPGSGVVPSAAVNLALSVSTQIQLTEKLGLLTEWLGPGTLDVYGEVSTQGVRLGVKLKKIKLLRDEATGKHDIEIDGNFDLQANSQGLQIGLLASMTINCPLVSRDLIQIEETGFFLQLASGGIGVQGAIRGKLRDLFGLKGLEVYGLSFICSFSMAESGIPDELGFTGAMGLEGMGGIKGHIALYYAQRSLTKCYFSGGLENVNIEAIVNFILKQQGLPEVAGDFLKGNAVINSLQLEAALQDMQVKQLDREVKAGFFYEANLYIKAGSYQWSGYTCIEVRKDAFQFIAMMSPISFAAASLTFFSLTRGSRSAAEYGIPQPRGVVDPQMLKDGPVLYISTINKQAPLFITARLQVIGFVAQIDLIGNKDGFDATLKTELHLSMLGLTGNDGSIVINVHVIPNQRARASLDIKANINLDLPGFNLVTGGGASTFMPGKQLTAVGAEIGFSFEIGWPSTGTGFKLNLHAKLKALGQTFNLASIEGNLRPEDLDSLEKVAAAVIKELFSDFPSLLKDALDGLGIGDIGKFVQDAFGSTGASLVTAVSALGNSNPADVMEKLGRDFLGFNSYGQSMKMLTDFGYDAGSAIQTKNTLGPHGKTPWEPSGKDPWTPSGKLPWEPSGKTPWDPSGDIPWSGGGVFGGSSFMKSNSLTPEDEQSSSKLAARPPPENRRENTSSEKRTSKLKITTASEVTPIEDAAGSLSAEVARKMAPPTREQVDAYLKVARLGLVQAALQYYPPKDVVAASEEVFSDLPRDEVRDYINMIAEQ